MKSNLLAGIAVAALVSLVGCYDSDTPSSSTSSQQSRRVPIQSSTQVPQVRRVPVYPPTQVGQPMQVAQPSQDEAESQRSKATTSQLESQRHYGNVSNYQRTSIQQSQDYLTHSKAKSFDPGGSP
jgi:hypothetical protein